MTVRCQFSQNSTPRPMHRRDQAAHELHQTGADQIPDALGVAHDARDQHAGLRRIEVANRQVHDLRLHALAHVGDRALRGHAEDLRQRKRRHRLHERRGSRGQRDRIGSRSVRFFPTTSSMRYFDDAGSTSPASRLTSIRTRPSDQPAAMRPEQRARLAPGGRGATRSSSSELPSRSGTVLRRIRSPVPRAPVLI